MSIRHLVPLLIFGTFLHAATNGKNETWIEINSKYDLTEKVRIKFGIESRLLNSLNNRKADLFSINTRYRIRSNLFVSNLFRLGYYKRADRLRFAPGVIWNHGNSLKLNLRSRLQVDTEKSKRSRTSIRHRVRFKYDKYSLYQPFTSIEIISNYKNELSITESRFTAGFTNQITSMIELELFYIAKLEYIVDNDNTLTEIIGLSAEFNL